MKLYYFEKVVMPKLEFTDYIVKVRYRDYIDTPWIVQNEILTHEASLWIWEYDWMDAVYNPEVIGWIRVEDIEVPEIGGDNNE